MINRPFFKISLKIRVQFPILIGFCLILLFSNLNCWDLWNPDEPRYAQVAREMVNGGDWILMHYNGKIYGHKPPLFFWLIGFSSFLWQGFTSFSVRFPSALFGTLTVLLTFWLGKNLYSSRIGFLSGLILATTYEFVYLSTRGNIDSTLTFFTTASIFFFLSWYRGNWMKGGYRRNLLIYGFYIGMALATLTKGPVGFILPLLVSLAYLIIQKDWEGIKKMKLLPGMILFIAIVLLWYFPALFKGGKTYFNETILRHSLDRFAEGTAHVHPFYFYFINFPGDFLPWTFFLPSAMVYGFSKGVFEKRKEFYFLFIWFAVIFLFFSISKGKRGLYLLPLYPSACLMIGKLLDDFISDTIKQFNDRWVSAPLYGLMGVLILAGGVLPWIISKKFPSYLIYSLPIAFFLIGGSLGMFLLFHKRYYRAMLFLFIGLTAGGYFYTWRVVFPLINPYKSARFISQEITTRIQPGEKLGIYGAIVTGPYNFYTGVVPIEELNNEESLWRFLRSSERVFCLIKYRDFMQFQTWKEKPEVQLIVRRQVGGNDMVLISNR